MALPQDVTSVLAALRRGTRDALEGNLVGVYLRGSLATGDFMASSDLDVLTVTERPIDDAEFAALVALHARLGALPSPYASRFELAYIDRVALRRFTPGQRHPTLYWGEALAWSEHGHNWILERWTVREHGVPLLGPDPKALIDPISADELRTAVRVRLRDWADWADQPHETDWPIVYTVETMCRALYTLVHGELSSKARAVAWAIATFPDPWRDTIERARAWPASGIADRAAIEGPVLRFVHWVTSADLDPSRAAGDPSTRGEKHASSGKGKPPWCTSAVMSTTARGRASTRTGGPSIGIASFPPRRSRSSTPGTPPACAAPEAMTGR